MVDLHELLMDTEAEPEPKPGDAAKELAFNILKFFFPGGGVLVHGQRGSGKTFLVIALLDTLLKLRPGTKVFHNFVFMRVKGVDKFGRPVYVSADPPGWIRTTTVYDLIKNMAMELIREYESGKKWDDIFFVWAIDEGASSALSSGRHFTSQGDLYSLFSIIRKLKSSTIMVSPSIEDFARRLRGKEYADMMLVKSPNQIRKLIQIYERMSGKEVDLAGRDLAWLCAMVEVNKWTQEGNYTHLEYLPFFFEVTSTEHAKPVDRIRLGDIIYDTGSPASLEMGAGPNARPFNFKALLQDIASLSHIELPYKILEHLQKNYGEGTEPGKPYQPEEAVTAEVDRFMAATEETQDPEEERIVAYLNAYLANATPRTYKTQPELAAALGIGLRKLERIISEQGIHLLRKKELRRKRRRVNDEHDGEKNIQ